MPKNKNRYYLLSLTVILLALSCASKTTTVQKQEIGAGQARITGQILKIEPIQNDLSKDICSRYPCIAQVKIKSIKTGSGFPALHRGQPIRVKFMFTLAPTQPGMFKNMVEKYPGLKQGDTFTAIINFHESMNDSLPAYQIYGYSLSQN